MRQVYENERFDGLQNAENNCEKKTGRIECPDKSGGCNSMKTIAFGSTKGGVGKSTTSIMTSNFLGQAGKRVLSLDLDSVNNAMTFYYADNPEEVEEQSIAEAIMNGDIGHNIIGTNFKNIDLIPSSFKLVNFRTMNIMTLKRLLKTIEHQYDYCIIDTSPAWDNISLNAYFAADKIITISNLTQWNWKTINFIRDQIVLDLSEEYLNRWSILINAFKKPLTDNPENYLNMVESLFSESFDNIIPVRIPNKKSLAERYIDTGERITQSQEKIQLYTAIQDLVAYVVGEELQCEGF